MSTTVYVNVKPVKPFEPSALPRDPRDIEDDVGVRPVFTAQLAANVPEYPGRPNLGIVRRFVVDVLANGVRVAQVSFVSASPDGLLVWASDDANMSTDRVGRKYSRYTDMIKSTARHVAQRYLPD